MSVPQLHPRNSRTAISLAALTTTALVLAGCGGDETDTEASAGTTSDQDSSDQDTGDDSGEACAPEDVTLVGQVRNQTNPYEAAWLDGGDVFAEQVGLEHQKLTYDGDSAKQQEQIRQVLTGQQTDCLVLNVLPNGDSDTTPIVRQADAAGAYVVTQWNKPADLAVTDYETWVSHITYDGHDAGQRIAEALFDAMGGSGGIVALQGILDTSAAKDRFAGLQDALAEHPDVTLLDDQTADFDRTKALDITKTLLTKHGDDLTGVWAANDDMALGALQALEAAGRAGEVPVVGIDAVPEAITAIADGEMTATVSSDGPWQGGIGLAMGYCAVTGELAMDEIPPENRAFFAEQFLITADNAEEFMNPTVDPAEFECANLFDRVAAPLR